MFNNWKIKLKAKNDRNCREFHITPVLTFAKPDIETEEKVGKGYALAVEWGKCYIMIIFYKIKVK